VGDVTKNKLEKEFYNDIDYFIDNSEQIVGTSLYGKKIYNVEKILKENKDEIIVILNTFDYYDEMSKQLEELGLTEKENFISIEDYSELIDENLLVINKVEALRSEKDRQTIENLLSYDSLCEASYFNGLFEKKYHGCDDYLYVNLNNSEIKKNNIDTLLFNNAIEFIDDIDSLLYNVNSNRLIIVYPAFELKPNKLYRKCKGYRNDYTSQELIVKIQKYNFKLSYSEYLANKYITMRFERM